MIPLAGTRRTSPTPEEIAAAVAAAGLEKVSGQNPLDVLRNVTQDDLKTLKPGAEVVKGNTRQPGGWLHAPAHLELYAAGDKRLTRVAVQSGISVKQVERVTPILVKNTTLLVLKAALGSDLTAVPVTRYTGSSSAWINVVELLGEAELTVETGYREWFEVQYVPEGSPLWPGLVLDLSQPKDRRQEPKRKKKNGDSEETQSQSTEKKA